MEPKGPQMHGGDMLPIAITLFPLLMHCTSFLPCAQPTAPDQGPQPLPACWQAAAPPFSFCQLVETCCYGSRASRGCGQCWKVSQGSPSPPR